MKNDNFFWEDSKANKIQEDFVVMIDSFLKMDLVRGRHWILKDRYLEGGKRESLENVLVDLRRLVYLKKEMF